MTEQVYSDADLSINITSQTTADESVNDYTAPAENKPNDVPCSEDEFDLRKDNPSCSTSSPGSYCNGLLFDKHPLQKCFIDSSGICSSCDDAAAMDAAFSCLFCKGYFHAVCRNADGDRKGKEIVCKRTFYNSFSSMVESDLYKKRPGNFHFVCDACQTKFENNAVATNDSKIDSINRHVKSLDKSVYQVKTIVSSQPQVSSNDCKVEALEDRVNELSGSIKELKELFVNSLNKEAISDAASSTSSLTPPTYSSVARKNNPAVLIVKEDSSGTLAKNTESIDNLLLNNGIQVKKSRVKTDGSTVFVCSNSSERQRLNSKLSEKFPAIQTHQPAELLPTISISNIPIRYTKDELIPLFMKGNPDISKLVHEKSEEFIVLTCKPQQRDNLKQQATVRVSNNIRKIIEIQGNRLYVGSSSCKVYDHFYVKRCNHCQKYNHYQSECKANHPTCGHCSETHESDSCPHKNLHDFYPCCPNCSKSDKHNNTMHTHSAFDRTCPSYQAEQNKLRKMTSYHNQKN